VQLIDKYTDLKIMYSLNPKNGVAILNAIEKQTISEKSGFRQSADLHINAHLHINPHLKSAHPKNVVTFGA